MSVSNFNILVIEDDPVDAEYLSDILEDVNDATFTMTIANSLTTAMETLSSNRNFDVIFLDLTLPESQGLETFLRVFEVVKDIPIIPLTGLDDQTVALEAMQSGAQDYVSKGNINGKSLCKTIRYAIERNNLTNEMEKIRDQDMQRKNAFLSHVSHELRSPLAIIYQFVTIFMDGFSGDLNATQKKHMGIVLRNTIQLRRMIDDLLEVARVDTGKIRVEPKPIDPTSTITEILDALRPLAMEKHIGLLTSVEGKLPSTLADPGRFRQILGNLIENAIKFTPANGSVTVEAQPWKHDDGFLCVSVRDTGTGISTEDEAKIFERLYQVNKSVDVGRIGLGLGLHICKDLVERQGGRIWVESPPDGGSIFLFTLPVYSLDRLLTPLVKHNTNHEEACLIMVNFSNANDPAEGLSSGKTAAVARQILERCIYPDRDILLPAICNEKLGDTFFIVATADHQGANILCDRIRGQLETNVDIGKMNLTADISGVKLESFSGADKKPARELLSDVAAEIDSLINGEALVKEEVA